MQRTAPPAQCAACPAGARNPRLPSHTHTAAPRRLLLAVSEYVVHHSKCNVGECSWLQPPHMVAAPWPASKPPRCREAAAMHLQCSRSVADLELPGALASWSGVCSHIDRKRNQSLLAVIHKDPKAVHAAAGSAQT